ncbi:ORF3 [callitrichine gammaherpesvirus 3]|uniref:ORF3 n=1 Tax=callitrichine gammaherpesvirus 3 TaxID=106331 RepID=Q993K8_9GAMA|nr:ORF3 [callitrichine gammaherpesvirus 3]AAK38210.1 ORF3 [callitrichine gammaherpesvirus 3]
MTGMLAAVYSQIYAVSFELGLCRHLDQSSLDTGAVTRNIARLRKLRTILGKQLDKQNEVMCTALSLELSHLLENSLIEAENLEKRNDLQETPILPSASFTAKFYGQYSQDVSMYLINDIEIFIKRLNSVFYCLSYNMGLEALNKAEKLLGKFRGVSPVPDPRLYLIDVPCWLCLHEQAVLPNQGKPKISGSGRLSCNHLAVPVIPEPVIGLFENEVRQASLTHLLKKQDNTRRIHHSREKRNTTEAYQSLDEYCVFSSVPPEISELSELLYWNSSRNSISLTGGEEETWSRLSKLISRDEEMLEVMRKCELALAGASYNHTFVSRMPGILERLFCGGIFSSVGDMSEALKLDCASAFTSQPQYRIIADQRNELYTRLNHAMSRLRRTENEQRENTEPHAPYVNQIQGNKDSSVIWSDAAKRREQYLRQLAAEGLTKLQACLARQGELMSETLALRVWGDTVYEEMAAMYNHFIARRAFVHRAWEDKRDGTAEIFENSKYIKTHLFNQTLSSEHVNALTMTVYSLLTGPLLGDAGMFPPPENVALSYSCEAAGILPHQKLFMASLVWPGIQPAEWIETSFNSFYQPPDGTLAETQQILARYIREATLTVSLYNKTWGQSVHLRRVDEAGLEGAVPPDGIYITYESENPLILILKTKGWIFKDLYALLYMHLQMVQDGRV